jgi:hypothetical protein
MDHHLKQLGLFNVLYGAIGFLVSLIVLLQQGSFHNLFEAFNDENVGLIACILVVFHLLIGIPCIVFGWLVRHYNNVGRVGLTVVSALNCLVPPVGTLLGAYGLWVLMSQESEPLFADAELRQRRGAKIAGEKRALAREEAEAAKKAKRASTSIAPSEP